MNNISYDKNYIASMIDHTLLKADAMPEQIEKLCREAEEYGFASVCVNPCYVKFASELLHNTKINVCTVIGFPLGASTTGIKTAEAVAATSDGASEVDMVINIPRLKAGDIKYVENEIKSVVKEVKGKAIVKVIIETCYLDEIEKRNACLAAKSAEADFVKTSTGFGTAGARVEDIILMRSIVGKEMGVKASGGIKDWKTAEAMICAGATRLGTSASIDIIREYK